MAHFTAKRIREMVSGAEKNGGSTEEIKNAVLMWDENASSVCFDEAGNIIINGKSLTDKEVEQWFFWTQGSDTKRK